MSADFTSAPHVGSEELAAYIDGRLDLSSAARVEAHLAECAGCRDDLVQARSLLDSPAATLPQSRAGRARWNRAWLAAAGILAIASLPLLQRASRTRGDTPRYRAAPTFRSHIDVIGPDARPVDVSAIVFVWRAVDGASTYRLTVTDSSGSSVFSVTTGDTAVRPPSGAKIKRGSSYLWYVDGITSEGRTMTSGIRSFSTSP